MRDFVVVLAALAVIAGSLYLAQAAPSSVYWEANSTSGATLQSKVKVGKIGSFDVACYPSPYYTVMTSGSALAFEGGLVCPEGTNIPFLCSLHLPSGIGSKANPYGGSYKFSSRKDDTLLVEGCRSSLGACLEQMDFGYRGNSTIPKRYKASAVTPLYGPVAIATLKVVAKTTDDPQSLSGKAKVTFTGTIVSGPYAGSDIRGSLLWTIGDAWLAP